MKGAFKQVLEEMVDEAERESDDEDVRADWKLAGERMLDKTPDEFRDRYRYMLSAFPDKPQLEPTLENWIRLGARLLEGRDPRLRRTMLKISLATNFKFDQDEMEENLS